jgi:heptaprenyl diphosphate synthase
MVASRPATNGEERGSQEEEEAKIALASLTDDSPLWSSCDYIVSTPGKRFRASVVESAAQYGEQPDHSLVTQSAIAIELFHAATLAHDDVVDDGQLRRGRATIGAHSGNLAASLTGGWLFARAAELIADVDADAITQFAEATSAVCEGEMIESRDLLDVDRTHDRYLTVIEAKTARLIAFASWLGAKVGGAGPEVVERLERYGKAVGIAFQIADDVLDLVADPASTGKTPGNDLRQGVYTLPTIYALEVDPVLRDSLLSGPEEDELPELVERIRETGAIDAALVECRAWIEQAVEALPQSDSPAEHEQQLLSLAGAVGARAEEMALL